MKTRIVSYPIFGSGATVLPDPLEATLTTPLGELPTGNIHYPVDGVNYTKLLPESEVAFQRWDGTAWVEPPNCRFFPMNGSFNHIEEIPTRGFTLLGFGWLLRNAKVWEPNGLPVDADGKVQFLSATPGTIMQTLITNAKGRGWGAGVAIDFSAATDSSGAAWSKIVTMAFDLEVSLETILTNLYQQGLCDFRWEGRTLRIFNPDTTMAREKTSVRLTVADGATSAPEEWTNEDRLTDTLVVGDKGLKWTFNNGATGGFGRLERVTTQSGVTDPATAQLLAARDLTAGIDARVSFTREFILDDATVNAPFSEYLIGDWVSAQRGTAFERLRVVSISLTIKPDEVKGHVVLGTRIDDILAKLAKRTSGITGGATAGGSGGRPAPDGPDPRVPSAPLGLVVGALPYTDENGFPQGRLEADWTHSGQATNGTVQTPDRYQLQRRINVAGEKWKMVAETTDTEVAVAPVAIFKADGTTAEQYAHRVRAVSEAGLVSEWSAQAITTMETDSTPPAAPYFVQANVTTWLMTVKVTWDGTLTTTGSNHIALPGDFERVDVYQDTQSNMATKVKIGEMYGPLDFAMVPAAVPGQTLYFHLVAVDRSGNASVPSANKNITPQANVDMSKITAQIDAAAVQITNAGSVVLQSGSTLTTKLAEGDAAILAAENAIGELESGYTSQQSSITNLQASVSGKNSIFNSTSVPSDTANPGTAVGDRWQKWTTLAAGGKITNTYRWNSGDTWVEEALSASYIPLLDIGAGTFGSLDGSRLVAGSVETKMLKVSDLVNFAPSPAESPTDWELSGGMAIVSSSLDVSGKRFSVADNAVGAFARGPYMTVKPGQKLYGYTKMYRGTGTTQTLYIRYYWYDKDKVALATPYTALPNGNGDGGTGGVLDGAVTVPSLAAYARYTVVAGVGTGSVGFYNVDGFRQSSTVQIANGAVTANEISASSVGAAVGTFVQANVSNLVVTGVATMDTAVVDKMWSEVVRSRSITADMLNVGRGDNMIAWNVKGIPSSYAPHQLLNGATATFMTDSVHSGKTSLYLQNAAVPTGVYTQVLRLKSGYTADNGSVDHWNVTPNQPMTIETYIRSGGTYTNGEPNVRLQIAFQTAAGAFHSTIYSAAVNTDFTWQKLSHEFDVPSAAASMYIYIQQDQPGGLRLDDPFMAPQYQASLIAQGAILAPHLTVTEEMWANIINFKLLTGDNIDVNDLIADTGWIGTLRGGILINDVVDTGILKADAITAKHTLTGATIQTSASAYRGIKMNGTSFKAYNSTGTSTGDTFSIDGTSGAVVGTGTWQTGTAGNYIKMYANANGGIMHLFTGSGSGRGSIWARAGADDRMSLTYSNLDEPSGTLPVVVLKATEAYMNYGSRTIKVWNNAGSEELLIDASNAAVVMRGNLDLRQGDSRVQFRYQGASATPLGYVGQRPESGTSAEFEFRADVGGVRLTGSSITAFAIYNSTTASAANVNVDSGGVLRRVSSASRYKADQRVMELDDSLLNIPVKDWIDKASVRERKAMDARPRPFIETDMQKFEALDLGRIPGVIAEDVERHGGKRFVIYGPDGRTESVMYDRLAMAQIAVLKRQLDKLAAEVSLLRA